MLKVAKHDQRVASSASLFYNRHYSRIVSEGMRTLMNCTVGKTVEMGLVGLLCRL